MGEALGCGALVEVLERTRIGSFRIEEALDPRTFTIESLADHLLPMSLAVNDLPRLRLDAAQVRMVLRGKALEASRLSGEPATEGEVVLFGPDGELVALAEAQPETGLVAPRKVLAKG